MRARPPALGTHRGRWQCRLAVADGYETLSGERHTVYRLADGLLLVFKPRGHREDVHAHPHPQRLRVLRGALVVRTARAAVTLDADSPPLTLAPGRHHATEALADTWLVAEAVGKRRGR
ncbi:MAG: hypothetical protein AB1689_04125 [Thermodesulfobacteriota bacterium]